MKNCITLPIAVILILAICGCNSGPKPEKIIQKYEGYTVINPNENNARITIEKINKFSGSYSIDVRCLNTILNENQSNADIIGSRLYVLNAENPAEIIPSKQISTTVTLSMPGKLPTKQFHSGVGIDTKDVKCKYALIVFKGIEKSEAEEVETPPLFFIVELSKKEPKLLTDKIFSAKELPAINVN